MWTMFDPVLWKDLAYKKESIKWHKFFLKSAQEKKSKLKKSFEVSKNVGP